MGAALTRGAWRARRFIMSGAVHLFLCEAAAAPSFFFLAREWPPAPGCDGSEGRRRRSVFPSKTQAPPSCEPLLSPSEIGPASSRFWSRNPFDHANSRRRMRKASFMRSAFCAWCGAAMSAVNAVGEEHVKVTKRRLVRGGCAPGTRRSQAR